MNITYVYPTGELSDRRVQVRCKNLAEAIQQTGYHQASLVDLNSFLLPTEPARQACQKADVIVIYKHLYGAALGMVEYWKARDKKVLVDFDQALDLLPADFEEHAFWNEPERPANPAAPGRTQASPL